LGVGLQDDLQVQYQGIPSLISVESHPSQVILEIFKDDLYQSDEIEVNSIFVQRYKQKYAKIKKELITKGLITTYFQHDKCALKEEVINYLLILIGVDEQHLSATAD